MVYRAPQPSSVPQPLMISKLPCFIKSKSRKKLLFFTSFNIEFMFSFHYSKCRCGNWFHFMINFVYYVLCCLSVVVTLMIRLMAFWYPKDPRRPSLSIEWRFDFEESNDGFDEYQRTKWNCKLNVIIIIIVVVTAWTTTTQLLWWTSSQWRFLYHNMFSSSSLSSVFLGFDINAANWPTFVAKQQMFV